MGLTEVAFGKRGNFAKKLSFPGEGVLPLRLACLVLSINYPIHSSHKAKYSSMDHRGRRGSIISLLRVNKPLLDSVQCIFDSGQWTMDSGQWTVDNGQ